MLEDKIKTEDAASAPDEVIPRNMARFGPSLVVRGELSGDEDLVIEGHFKGKINLSDHNLLVGKGGKIEADIRARNITITGSVVGNLYASGKVFISREGRMEGNIHSPVISIMDGAHFKGSISMEQRSGQVGPLREGSGT